MATETPGPEDPWILVWFPADEEDNVEAVKFAARGFDSRPAVLNALRLTVRLGAQQDPDEERVE